MISHKIGVGIKIVEITPLSLISKGGRRVSSFIKSIRNINIYSVRV